MSVTTPVIVAALCTNFESWVVGSSANPDNVSPRDWDILVPLSQWNRACHLIPKDARPNSFGGWKFTENGVEVDVWPGELSFVANQGKFKWAWNTASNRRLMLVGD